MVTGDRPFASVPEEAALVQRIFARYLALGSVHKLKAELDATGPRTPERRHRDGSCSGGAAFSEPTRPVAPTVMAKKPPVCTTADALPVRVPRTEMRTSREVEIASPLTVRFPVSPMNANSPKSSERATLKYVEECEAGLGIRFLTINGRAKRASKYDEGAARGWRQPMFGASPVRVRPEGLVSSSARPQDTRSYRAQPSPHLDQVSTSPRGERWVSGAEGYQAIQAAASLTKPTGVRHAGSESR